MRHLIRTCNLLVKLEWSAWNQLRNPSWHGRNIIKPSIMAPDMTEPSLVHERSILFVFRLNSPEHVTYCLSFSNASTNWSSVFVFYCHIFFSLVSNRLERWWRCSLVKLNCFQFVLDSISDTNHQASYSCSVLRVIGEWFSDAPSCLLGDGICCRLVSKLCSWIRLSTLSLILYYSIRDFMIK